jgi:hypothetical protein
MGADSNSSSSEHFSDVHCLKKGNMGHNSFQLLCGFLTSVFIENNESPNMMPGQHVFQYVHKLLQKHLFYHL